MSTNKMRTDQENEGQIPTSHTADVSDEETAKELAEHVLALSLAGRSMVIHALLQARAYPVVAAACQELGLFGVLENMAVWCHRGWVIHADDNPTEAAVDRWQETLLRAFQQALNGPPRG